MARIELERFLRSNVALIASVAFILLVTLPATNGKHEVHLGPLQDIVAVFSPSLNLTRLAGVIGNVLLFAPLGIVLGVRGGGGRRVVVIGAVLSIAIEATQFLIPGRTTSVDDVLLNTLGIATGYLASTRVGSGRTGSRSGP